MTLFFALACASDVPLEQPNPPPSAPPQLAAVEADVVTINGSVSEVHAATRTFITLGEGRREICHLTANGTLEIDGKVAQVADLADGMSIAVEGVTEGDLMLVRRAVALTSAPEPAPPPVP